MKWCCYAVHASFSERHNSGVVSCMGQRSSMPGQAAAREFHTDTTLADSMFVIFMTYPANEQLLVRSHDVHFTALCLLPGHWQSLLGLFRACLVWGHNHGFLKLHWLCKLIKLLGGWNLCDCCLSFDMIRKRSSKLLTLAQCTMTGKMSSVTYFSNWCLAPSLESSFRKSPANYIKAMKGRVVGREGGREGERESERERERERERTSHLDCLFWLSFHRMVSWDSRRPPSFPASTLMLGMSLHQVCRTPRVDKQHNR